MNKTTLTPKTNCPYCGAKLDAATPAYQKEIVPDPGSVSMCVMCCEWLVFTEDLKLRKPTPEERTEFSQIPELIRVQQVGRMLAQKRNQN
jgi:hypothetical protein